MNLNKLIDRQKTFVDVRTPNEYASGHVPGAINIPLDEIQNRLDECKNLPKPLVAYCRSGARSGMATSILMQAGIQDVINGGGISEVLQQIK
jgi:phage shock protein E